MNRIFRRYKAASLLCLTSWLGLITAAPAAAKYHLVKKIVLGGEGGWDYFDVDERSRVFIPRDSHILVLDVNGLRIADIPNVHGAHAIAFAPELKRAFLSTEGSVTILDTETLKIVREVPLPGKDPDAILYDPFSRRVFTFNGGGSKDATAIDASTGVVLGSVPLGGKPETAQADRLGHVYATVEDQNKIVVFDAKTLRTTASWALAPCDEPAGLAIDLSHKRLFAGCHNNIMAVLDYTTGKVVASIPIGKGIDASRFDPETGLAFASGGDGTITVAHEDSPDHYTPLQTIPTEKGARTMALDLKTHNLYTVTAQFGPPPPPTPQNPHPYPSVISKTFTLLIFAP